MNIAEDIGNDTDIMETENSMVERIAKELSKYTEENVVKWYSYVNEYRQSIENIRMENVEQMLTNTHEGILKVEAF